MLTESVILALLLGVSIFLVLVIAFRYRHLKSSTQQITNIPKKKKIKKNIKVSFVTPPLPTENDTRENNFQKNFDLTKVEEYISTAQLHKEDIAKIFALIIGRVPNEYWSEILPNLEFSDKLNAKDLEILELLEVSQSLNERLSVTNDSLQSTFNSSTQIEDSFRETIKNLQQKIGNLEANLTKSRSLYIADEQTLHKNTEACLKRRKECSSQNIKLEKENARLRLQIDETNAQNGWEVVSLAEERLSCLQDELCFANKQLVGTNNRLEYIKSQFPDGDVPQVDTNHVETRDKLVIKEAKVVQLTNIVTQLTIDLHNVQKSLQDRTSQLNSLNQLSGKLNGDCSEKVDLPLVYEKLETQLMDAYDEMAN